MKRSQKKKILICSSLLIAISVCFSSCLPLSFIYSIDEYENEIIESETEIKNIIPAPELGKDRETITLDKNEGNNSENENVTSAGQPYNSISEVFYSVSDSVVEITTEVVINGTWMGQYVSEGAGSGVIIDESGLIVTNYHVIESATNITVRLTDGEEFAAAVVGYDDAADLAVLKIDASGHVLTVAPLGCSADLVVGEDIIVIGNPLGSLGGTLTTGIISATERTITVNNREMVLLQTNAAINPGNSGGGLFNMAGELVGVVNAKMAGSDVEGLGFAIPVDYAHAVMEDLINYGYVRGIADHGLILLDVTSQNLPAAYAKYGITSIGVVVIESKLTDKLKYGDTVISVNGEKISSSVRLDTIVRSCKVGESITVTVNRNGETVNVTYTLGERGANTIDFD